MAVTDTPQGQSRTNDSAWLLMLAAFAIPLAALAAAWGLEIIGGFEPCALCLTQRIPYYVGLPIAAFGLFLYRDGKTSGNQTKLGLTALVMLAFAIAMAVAAGYGIYHVGVEYEWWPGPTACSSAGSTPATVDELLSQLGRTMPVSCTDVPLRIFGISLAGWNAIVTGGATLMAVSAAFQIRSQRTSN